MRAISAILLAAGFSSRFGVNKLLFPVEKESMFESIYKKVCSCKCFSEIIVVTQYDEVERIIKEGKVVRNLSPEEGISSSIKLGVQAAKPENALMFFVCDQPFLSEKTICGMIESYEKGILCASFGEKKGNPVIFDACYRQELLNLSGDVGGRTVIKAHPEEVICYPVSDSLELEDMDEQKTIKL